MIHLPLVIKSTLIGKFGAFMIATAPLIFAVEIKSHIDALIAAFAPTLAIVVGVFALKKGQEKIYIQMDGRMTDLLKATKEIAHAAGKEEGQTERSEVAGKLAHAEGKEQERVEARDRRSEGSAEG